MQWVCVRFMRRLLQNKSFKDLLLDWHEESAREDGEVGGLLDLQVSERWALLAILNYEESNKNLFNSHDSRTFRVTGQGGRDSNWRPGSGGLCRL